VQVHSFPYDHSVFKTLKNLNKIKLFCDFSCQ
jgi:hypothetical protein